MDGHEEGHDMTNDAAAAAPAGACAQPEDGLGAPVRAVAFDMDGVLVDSEPAWGQAIVEFLARYGKSLGEQDAKGIYGCSYEFVIDMCVRITGVDQKTIAAELGSFVESYEVDYSSLGIPGARDLVRDLHEAGLRTALATSSLRWQAEDVIEQCGMQGLFDVVIAADMVHEAKPAPDIYLTTASRLGIPPEEVVAIEDSAYGVAAGVAAGMRVIRLNRLGASTVPGAMAECADYGEVCSVLRRLGAL
jgi:HAD superfamily hydrolase (TIGR01509 family)